MRPSSLHTGLAVGRAGLLNRHAAKLDGSHWWNQSEGPRVDGESADRRVVAFANHLHRVQDILVVASALRRHMEGMIRVGREDQRPTGSVP